LRAVYGINPVLEALRSGAVIDRVFVSEGRGGKAASDIMRLAGQRKVEVAKAAPRELTSMAGTERHQGVVALLHEEFRYSDIEDLIAAWKKRGGQAFFLVLDSVQDPQNLGSLVRTANAAGVHGVVIPKDRAAEVTPAVVKASAGATEHTMIAREVNITRAIERLKDEGVWAVAVEAGCRETLWGTDLDRDLALVIGSEGKGIRRLVRERCDLCASIPMSGQVNSLNAAQAGAIAMFEALRQRRE